MYLENLKEERQLSVKSDVNFRNFYVFLAIVLILQTPSNVFAEAEDAAAHRTATAVRITGAPPQIDGVLDDQIWKNAPLHEGFRQREPDEAKPALASETSPVSKISTHPVILRLCLTSWDAHASTMTPTCGATSAPMCDLGLPPELHLTQQLTPILDRWKPIQRR